MKFTKFIIIFLIQINYAYSENISKAYFAGGCFWCMEESFEKLDGVKEVISGYSGGTTSNPTYKEVEQVAEKWKPYRSAATWYLWRSIDPIPVSY